MSERICTACGSNELKPIPILFSNVCRTEGEVRQTVDSFYCVKCGHVELYARTAEVDKHLKQEAKQKAAEDESRAREEEIRSLESKIAELRNIIADENQTVKAVKEAKSELNSAENKLRELKASRPSKFTMHKLYRWILNPALGTMTPRAPSTSSTYHPIIRMHPFERVMS